MQKKLLLVEDEPVLQLMEQTQLEEYGYSVLLAKTGEEAVEIASQDESIDLVLMDIDLGSGIDGTEAARQILVLRELPIVFLSGHTEREIVRKTEKITSYGYVVKNTGMTVLDASVKMAFKLFDTEKKAKKQSENYKKLFDDHSAVKLLIDPNNGKIVDANKAALKYYGYSRKEILSMKIQQINCLSPEEVQAEMKRARELSKVYFQFRHRLANGEIRNVNVFSNNIVLNGRDLLHSIIFDVTEQKKIEQQKKLLNSFVNEMLTIEDTQTLYDYVAKQLHLLYPEAYVIYLSFKPERGKVQIKAIRGKDDRLFSRVMELTGYNPVRAEFNVRESLNSIFVSGSLKQFSGGLAAFSGKEFPSFLAKKVEEILGIREIYTIGMLKDKQLIGAIHFFCAQSSELKHDKAFVESFVQQAGIILHQKQLENQLKRSLKEKEALVREVHHRIKNNILSISSTMIIKAEELEEGSAKNIINDSISRIENMRILYESLLQPQSSYKQFIPVHEYMNKILSVIQDIYGEERRISLHSKIVPIFLDQNRLVIIGSIVNELLCNSLKYAFPDNRQGRVSLEIKKEKNQLVLEYSDNGVGFSMASNEGESSGLGVLLIKMLSEQLNGNFVFESQKGVLFSLKMEL